MRNRTGSDSQTSERRKVLISLNYSESRKAYDGDGVTDGHLRGRHDGEIGHVDEHVADGDEGDGDGDCQGQVLLRVLDLLRHVVEVVPAVVRPQPGVEGHGDVAGADGDASAARDQGVGVA